MVLLRSTLLLVCLMLTVFIIDGVCIAEDERIELDWPTYRYDDQRSAQYPRDLIVPLQQAWVHRPARPPRPAWPGTAQSDFWRNRATPEKSLVDFDKAYFVVAAKGSVLYGSSADDQIVCLDLKSGQRKWQYFAEGPIRLAPTIAGNRVVFGSDDGFIYCLSVTNGELLWREPAVAGDAGKRRPGNGRMIGKHPVRSGVLIRDGVVYYAAGLFPKQGVWHGALAMDDGRRIDCKPMSASVQGYIREQDGKIFVPTGRHPAGAFLQDLKRRGKVTTKQAAVISSKYPYAFVATPTRRFVGGDGEVAALDGGTGEIQWKAELNGRALGLAIAGDTLLVSTDQGATYAFRSSQPNAKHDTESSGDPESTTDPNELETVNASKTPNNEPEIPHPEIHQTARNILARCGRTRGYALVVADDEGKLTMELGRQSKFQVIGIGVARDSLLDQRNALARAGLYGQVVLHDVSVEEPPYLNHLFNLIVVSSKHALDEARWLKLLRPGGQLVHGPTTKVAPIPEGAGSWSHLYGNPGNTSCSRDTLSTDQLELQWFGEPGPQKIIDRHLRAMAPVARDGLLFVPGNDYLYGVDAFNGAILWEKSIEAFRRVGVLRGSGSLAVGSLYLYAAAKDHCLVLERTTGRVHRRLSLPASPEKREWGYLAILDDTLIGSAAHEGGVYRTFSRDAIYGAGYGDNKAVTVSTELFATDAIKGNRLWQYQPRGAILDPSIAVNRDYVMFLESRASTTLEGPARNQYSQLLDTHGGDLVAIDRHTGKESWRRAFQNPKGIQTLFLLCTDQEMVVAFSRNSIAEGAGKPTVHYESRVYDSNGKLRWSQSFDTKKRPNLDHGEQDRHPAIVGSRLVVEPNIYDLQSGKLLDTFNRGYGCGTISASASHLFFRSGHPASYSFSTRAITPLNAVSRPGCWINVITSDGLVLVPEASSGCICKFPLQCSMAFAPKE